jgi:glucosamine 6-phosphate synthetase-like amidotransferase/phosphosugar isomerase protein
MCGIFGYIGTKTNAGVSFSKVSNRLNIGAMIHGVALKNINNDLFIEKHTGKIGDATLPS